MSTRAQRIAHWIDYWVATYPLVKGMAIWFPIHNFFRKLWWKAWGHDPAANPTFHLDQISFDHDFANRMQIGSAVHSLAVGFHGKNRIHLSRAWTLMTRFQKVQYIPFDDYEAISALFDEKEPGPAITNWFITVDRVTSWDWRAALNTNVAFSRTVASIAALKYHEPALNPEDKEA